MNIYCDPCPSNKGTNRQRFYRIRKKYLVKESHSVKYLYEVVANSQSLLRVVPKESFFDLLENIHAVGGNHLEETDYLYSSSKNIPVSLKKTSKSF